MRYRREFVEHLPALRRHARALAGCQEVGDHLVISTLRRISQLPADGEENAKVILFNVLFKLWNGVVGEQIRSSMIDTDVVNAIDYRLAELPQLSRQAFLLVVLENFVHEDAAKVLQISLDEFDGILAEAMTKISSKIATTVAIVEDEPFVTADLERIMNELGHFVVKISSTHAETQNVIKNKKPGLFLVNIEKVDHKIHGLESVEDVITKDSIPIVFFAAHTDVPLTDTRREPKFFISQPFESRVVQGVINRALFLNGLKYPTLGKTDQAQCSQA